MSQVAQAFYGKYRGRVVDADDPLALGRVRVQVPDVLGSDMFPWVLPCVPMTHPSAALLALVAATFVVCSCYGASALDQATLR